MPFSCIKKQFMLYFFFFSFSLCMLHCFLPFHFASFCCLSLSSWFFHLPTPLSCCYILAPFCVVFVPTPSCCFIGRTKKPLVFLLEWLCCCSKLSLFLLSIVFSCVCVKAYFHVYFSIISLLFFFIFAHLLKMKQFILSFFLQFLPIPSFPLFLFSFFSPSWILFYFLIKNLQGFVSFIICFYVLCWFWHNLNLFLSM